MSADPSGAERFALPEGKLMPPLRLIKARPGGRLTGLGHLSPSPERKSEEKC